MLNDASESPSLFKDGMLGVCAGGCPVFMPTFPNIDTRSSKGFVEVPASKFAAAGVDVSVVAASPDGWLSSAGASSKSRRFSAC